MGPWKWSFKKDNDASLFYYKLERVVKNTSITKWVTGYIWTQGERIKNGLSMYFTPLNPRFFFYSTPLKLV